MIMYMNDEKDRFNRIKTYANKNNYELNYGIVEDVDKNKNIGKYVICIAFCGWCGWKLYKHLIKPIKEFFQDDEKTTQKQEKPKTPKEQTIIKMREQIERGEYDDVDFVIKEDQNNNGNYEP